MKTIHKKNNNIVYIKGNIFDNITHYVNDTSSGCSVIVPHVCNNVGAFGAGFVASINEHYPIVKENYLMLGKKFLQQNLGYTQYVEVSSNKLHKNKLIFANMIAQNGTISSKNKRPLNYAALVNCMISINKYISLNFSKDDNEPQIHCPRFGCGLAGGNWNFVENLIEDIWSKYTVFVYHL